MDEIVEAAEQFLGRDLNRGELDLVVSMLETFSKEVIIEGFKRAKRAGGQSLRYVERIMEQLRVQGWQPNKTYKRGDSPYPPGEYIRRYGHNLEKIRARQGRQA